MSSQEKWHKKVQEIGLCYYMDIKALMKRLSDANNTDDSTDDFDDIYDEVMNRPLELSVRNREWRQLGEGVVHPDQYNILLATGGPAVRIIGELENNEVITARLEVQDWFQPWTQFQISESPEIFDFANLFCFEEF